MKKNIIALVVIILIAVGAFYLLRGSSKDVTVNQNPQNQQEQKPADQTPKDVKPSAQTVIGKSVEGRDIIAYNFGNGDTQLLFVGGIHGGYEWNTAKVAYEAIDYLKANPSVVPANVKVTVIPVLNPDGLNKVVGTTTGNFSSLNVSGDTVVGRFNANNVDLNRNFDCDWKSTGKWQNKTVSGGDSAFSEPESLALKNYVELNKPTAVVAWYSAAGGVYASSCHNGVSSETNTLTQKFASASGYPAYETFDFYAITGDMVNWFAKNNIPAISVLLSDHIDTQWSKNQAGIQALLRYYAK